MGFLCQSLYIPYKLWMFCRLSETRSGEICNACVLLVKRWKKLPVGTKKNWNHVSLDHITDGTERWLDQANSFSFEIPSSKVVDARGGPSLKITSRPKKIKSISKRARPSQISRLQKELKRHSGFLCDFEFKMSSLKKKKTACLTILVLFPIFLCRFWRSQHHLQCLSSSVSKLQQPVRRRFRHWAQSRFQPLPRFLFFGSNLLEEV